MSHRSKLVVAGIVVAWGAGGCSSSGGGAKLVTQTGRMIAYTPCGSSVDATPVEGATITIGSETTVSAKDGTYSIPVPAGTPFTMTVTKTTAPTYAQLLEAVDTVEASYNRGDTQLIATTTAQLLSSALPNYDATRSLLSVELMKTGSCTDLNGSTIKVSPSNADALTQYPASCISPVGNNPYATDNVTPPVFPTAVVYNLAPATVTVAVTSPKCTQIPFPYTDPTTGLTYDGAVTTQAGLGTSFIRIFMK
jgi:hypothetical protein